MRLLTNKITRNAIIFTLCILVVYRIGFFTITPLVNGASVLSSPLLDSSADAIFNFMGGGNISTLSIFALGVAPFITASIIIQLLESDLIPAMAEWKHQGVDGQNKRQSWTRNLAIILAFIQALGVTLGFYFFGQNYINPIGGTVGVLDFALMALFMTTGTAIMIWLADRITEKGVGNGMSVMIMVGIIARMPVEINNIWIIIKNAAYNGNKGLDLEFYRTLLTWSLIFLIFLLLVVLVVYYTLAYRKVAINYVKNAKSKSLDQSYIPIRLNPAGVIPILFVIPLMQLPLLIMKLPMFSNNGVGPIETVGRAFFDLSGTYWYVATIVYVVLIVGFSVMYSYIQMNPETMAENLDKQSAYVVGIRPGKDTEEYLTRIILRTSVYGGMVLALLGIMPTILQNVLDLSIRLNLIGTGLIITVNVLVQTYTAMENKVESKTYKTLM